MTRLPVSKSCFKSVSYLFLQPAIDVDYREIHKQVSTQESVPDIYKSNIHILQKLIRVYICVVFFPYILNTNSCIFQVSYFCSFSGLVTLLCKFQHFYTLCLHSHKNYRLQVCSQMHRYVWCWKRVASSLELRFREGQRWHIFDQIDHRSYRVVDLSWLLLLSRDSFFDGV